MGYAGLALQALRRAGAGHRLPVQAFLVANVGPQGARGVGWLILKQDLLCACGKSHGYVKPYAK